MMKRLKSQIIGKSLDVGLSTITSLARYHPTAKDWCHGVEVVSNLAYADDDDPAHLLDIYRPVGRSGPYPIMFYVHGGGFRILSKDSHWMFAHGFARAGWLVFSINYRLAPAHPYPAPLEDTCTALDWVLEHAKDYGGLRERLVYGGDSAGANLITSLAIAGSWRRPETFATRIFQLDPRPKAILPACGILQVSAPERYLERKDIPAWVRGRIASVCQGYYPVEACSPSFPTLADPLCILEQAEPPERPFPACFAVCGQQDPIAQDTHRLGSALDRFDAPSKVAFYEGQGHAFQALFWRSASRTCWQEQLEFLAAHT
jgi:acetyl esterase